MPKVSLFQGSGSSKWSYTLSLEKLYTPASHISRLGFKEAKRGRERWERKLADSRKRKFFRGRECPWRTPKKWSQRGAELSKFFWGTGTEQSQITPLFGVMTWQFFYIRENNLPNWIRFSLSQQNEAYEEIIEFYVSVCGCAATFFLKF